jgi:hypothetical protein
MLGEPGSDTVGLSRIVNPMIEENAGRGIVLDRSGLYGTLPEGEEGQTGLVGTVRPTITGGTVADNGGIGIYANHGAAALKDISVERNGGIGLFSYGGVVRVNGLEVRDTKSREFSSRGEETVSFSDGIVLSGSEQLPAHLLGRAVDVESNTVTGSGRVGMLVVRDEYELGGRIEMAPEMFSDNAHDFAVLGTMGSLEYPRSYAGTDAAASEEMFPAPSAPTP